MSIARQASLPKCTYVIQRSVRRSFEMSDLVGPSPQRTIFNRKSGASIQGTFVSDAGSTYRLKFPGGAALMVLMDMARLTRPAAKPILSYGFNCIDAVYAHFSLCKDVGESLIDTPMILNC